MISFYIHPISKGALTIIQNMVLICKTCNSKKSKSLEVLQSPFELVQAPEIEIGIAWRSETCSIPFSQSLNKISGDIICPYPPGIPLLVPGEKIDIDRFNWINNQSLCNKDLLNFNIRVI